MDTQDLELAVSPEELCRTCLAAVDRTQLKPIFCNEILGGRIVPFPSVMELAIGEKFVKNDKLPNNVCVECKGKLRDLYLFVGVARKSSKLLYEIFSVEAPKPVVEKRSDSKHAETQTDAFPEGIPMAAIEPACPAPVEMIEIGTQWEDDCSVEKAVPETSRHAVGKVIKQQDEDKQDGCSYTSSPKEDVPLDESSFDGALLNTTDDDENDYDVLLLTDEPNFTLDAIKPVRDKSVGQMDCTVTKKETTTHSTLVSKILTRSAEKKASRKRIKHERACCTYCNLTGRSEALARHFQTHKETLELCLESIDYYRCSDCFTVFISQTDMTEHFGSECKRVPSDEYVYHSDLHKHETFYLNGPDICVPRLKTFKKQDNKFRCGQCSKFATSCFDTMRGHCLTHEADDDKTDDVNLLWKNNHLDEIHICGLCEAQFPDATYIRQHLYFHQEAFVCVYDCGMTFASFLRITRHFERKHTHGQTLGESTTTTIISPVLEEANHQCKQCAKTLPTAESLRNHLRNHFRPRKYVCTECKKCFSQKSDLIIHCRIHTDERPYTCAICEKKFRTNSHLRDHMFTHEQVNKFECDVCHKLFKAKRILVGHQRLHTGERPHMCDLCQKSFTRKQHLMLHLKTHTKPTRSVATVSARKTARTEGRRARNDDPYEDSEEKKTRGQVE
uniref:Protein krueppel n=1 Tax=Anopheles dirus TaxID=7168 RepID=A0A182NDD2_9DIPT